jgi:DNA-binding transcriptional ArsR family regulator
MALSFLTNHFYVLRALSGAEGPTLREVAGQVGITERAVQRIVGELEEAGYLKRRREGRRNRYALGEGTPGREPRVPLRELLDLAADESPRVRSPDGISRNQSFID